MDIEPKFGAKSQELKAYYRNGFVPYGDSFDFLMNTMERLVEQGMFWKFGIFVLL
jgi:vesicle-fusing ATPase